MGAHMRAFDWASTSLGPPDRWPQSLRTVVRLMLNTRHPIFVFWGPENICLYNDAYSKTIGPERHPVALGQPGREVWDEIWDVIGPQIKQVMAGGEATWFENQLLPITRNGVREDVYWTYSYNPIDEENAPNGVGGALVLVTETTLQVLTATKLSISEERLQQALSAGHGVGTYDWDIPADRVVADARFAKLYGVDPARAALGAPIAEFFQHIHPDDFSQTKAKIDEAMLTGGLFSAEYRLQQADGSTPWVLAEGRCRLGPGGEPVRFFGVAFDITARKTAELRRAALLTLTDRVRDIDDPNALAFAASTILGETLHASRVCYGTIDHDAETLTVDRDWRAAGVESSFGPINLRDYGSFIDDLKEGLIVVVRDVDQNERTTSAADALKACGAASFVNAPVVERGRLEAVFFVGNAAPRDWAQEDLDLIEEFAERIHTATERLRAVAALRASNETLETRVAERTEQLLASEAALRQAQKMEAVGQLTGGIAHDFNNLLAGIAGSLELIQKRMNDQGVVGYERHLGIAQASTQRAASLTQRLLAFSRRQTLDPKPVEMNRLVRGVEELLGRSVSPNIEIAVVEAVGLWLTKIDAVQLENALLNLVINARDAMPDGGRITIETANKSMDAQTAKARDLAPGQYVSLCVTDTGTGMPPDVVERAFDPFYTTKPLGQGTGLGLSMIHGFVRQSGGQVRVYSEVGQGTTMCLYFPRYAGDLDVEGAVEIDAAIEPSQGETVLVIDDEESIRMLIAEVLKEAGYRVLEAADGVAGLEILQSDSRIDLLITDVGLPGGFNGRQVADAARQTRPDLKVLFVTGYAANAVVGNGHLDPGMRVITKPFAMTALALRVREIIES